MHQAKKKNYYNFQDEDVSLKGAEDPFILKFHNLNQELPALKVVEKESQKKVPIFTLKEPEEVKKVLKKKYKSKNYFGVKNHFDLFEIGKHYSQRVEEGCKSFAFLGKSQSVSTHHSILGLASYFNYHKNMKVVVFTENFKGSELQKFLTPTHIEAEMVDECEEDTIESYSCDGIEVVDLSKIRHIAHKIGAEAFMNYLHNYIERSELVFWDLPELKQIDKEREFYQPIISNLHSLSLIVEAGVTRQDEVKKIYAFAGKYQIKMEGAIFYRKKVK